MAETSQGASGRTVAIAAVLALVVGAAGWVARPYLAGVPAADGTPSEEAVTAAPDEAPPVPDAVAAETDAPSAMEAAEAPEQDATGTFEALPEETTSTAEEIAALPEAPSPAGDSVPPTPSVPAPTFDVVRIAPDGGALVAGRAAPGARVTVLLDGAEVGGAEADGTGNFVSMFSVGPSENARVVSLLSDGVTGEAVSEQEIIVAPMPAPGQAAADAAEAEAAPGEAEPQDLAVATGAPEAQTELPAGPASGAAGGPEIAETPAEDAPEPAAPEPPAAPTLLLSEGGAVRVIQSGAPEVMDRVAIDAITYDVDGEVTLTGRAQGSGFVRVYLDNVPLLTTEIAEDGNWRSELPEVDTGVYTLRVDRIDAEGNVTARAETPFLREPVDQVRTIANDLRDNILGDIVTVQPGDHLWGIATRRYGEGMLFVKVFEANRDQIRDPDLIYPGQIFELPEE